MNDIMNEWRKFLENEGIKFFNKKTETENAQYFIDKDMNLIGLLVDRIKYIINGKVVINYNLNCDKNEFVNKIKEYKDKSNKNYSCCIGCEYFQIREDKCYCWKGAKNPNGILGSGFSTFTKKEKCDKGER